MFFFNMEMSLEIPFVLPFESQALNNILDSSRGNSSQFLSPSGLDEILLNHCQWQSKRRRKGPNLSSYLGQSLARCKRLHPVCHITTSPQRKLRKKQLGGPTIRRNGWIDVLFFVKMNRLIPQGLMQKLHKLCQAHSHSSHHVSRWRRRRLMLAVSFMFTIKLHICQSSTQTLKETVGENDYHNHFELKSHPRRWVTCTMFAERFPRNPLLTSETFAALRHNFISSEQCKTLWRSLLQRVFLRRAWKSAAESTMTSIRAKKSVLGRPIQVIWLFCVFVVKLEGWDQF